MKTYIYVTWSTEPRDQILHGNWWKFWPRDTGGATRPDTALPLADI